jgi:uncharacterized protein Yka (UPF0111/DUF47 family)
MKKEYGELVEYLDKKFAQTLSKKDFDTHVESVDKRFDVVTKEVISLRTDMDRGFAELKDDFRQLQNSVDNYAAKADKFFMELIALANKVDRLERWIQEIAEKVGIKLK